MAYNPENLEAGNKSETGKPIKQVSESTVKGLGATAIKGAAQ